MVFDIWKQIKAKRFAPVYLLYGTEPYLINETKQLLINYVLSPEEADFNLSTYDLEETPIDTALEDAETFPFMGERRLIFLHNPVFLTSEKSKAKIEHNLAKLEAYIKEPAPYSVVVLAASSEKLDDRKKLTKQLKKTAAVLEAKKLNEGELKTWIRERAALNGVQIDEAAVELVLTLAGTNLFILTSEIDKLALYANDTKRIDEQMVEKMVSRSLEQNIFSLVDKIVHRKIEEALRIYYDLLKQNEEPIKILSVITGQFRLIYQVKELARRGYGQQQIAGYLKIHPFRVKLAAGQAQLFGDEELTIIMSLLADADYQMKTGGMNKTMLIEMFLFRLQSQALQKHTQ
ncbi:DNA polymerase III subunit delta [Bacillus sp. ISL-47]|uniref:DNA polymerase III subunit delta n=1 Tax=Bacillus sp. ISL-47 TaxID=2819130 RepID=UPI001BE59E60|nr:DNA polymerase III subunit delta [Bacillus sp. ISL-47]MBT2690289.1 DNA polymerase III subunit delta [Bacillus sp. ISL-47]MBT2708006.1 DNA polymerase III subunit delta [Pseudomonas sp. ISL-84]